MLRFNPIPGGGPVEGPLSPAQERIWRFEQVFPGSAVFHICLWSRIEGDLTATRVEEALHSVMRRHEALRTGIVEREGEAIAVVMDSAALPFEARHLGALVDEGMLWDRAVRFCERPFTLDRPPLFRALLLETDTHTRFLVICVHHLVFDGWSVPLLLKDFLEACESPEHLEKRPRPSLRLADYARWHRHLLASGEFDRDIQSALDRLDGSATAEIPVDFPRPQTLDVSGDRLELKLSLDESASLDAAARRLRMTPACLLLGSYLMVLQRNTGADELVVGVPASGRNHRELEELVGLFSDLAVLRFDLSGNPPVGEFLASVQRALIDAMEAAYLPFTSVMDRLDSRRDPVNRPLVQHLFAMETSFSPALERNGLRLEPRTLGLGLVKADVSLLVWDGEGGLRLEIEYRSAVYEKESAARWLRQLRDALVFLAEDEDRLLGSWRLPEAVEWIQGPPETPKEAAQALASIRMRAESQPGALAVRDEHAQWSYEQLWNRASAVSAWLRGQGIAPGTRIGLCLGRRAESVAGILGVFAAGCAAVPLDESQPVPRLKRLLEEADAAGLLTWETWRGRFDAVDGLLVCPWEQLGSSALRSDEMVAKVDRAGAAYVVFTSGTTGVPRAVEVSRGNLDAYCSAVLERFGFEAGWNAAILQSFAVDFSYTMLFPILMQGGSLRLFNRETSMDPWRLAEDWRRDPVDVLKITPSHLKALLREAPAQFLLPRRRLILGGESSNAAWVEDLVQHGGLEWEAHNHYGPTETTVGVLTWRCGLGDRPRGNGMTPLGRPLAHARVSVRDRFGHALPPGAEGELWIGGDAVATGYRNDWERQAECFLEYPGPLGAVERIYRSGDRARSFSDGVVEFCGRVDDQVKVRGHRVELAEVAAVLACHWSVAEATVIARREGEGVELEGFVTAAQPVALSGAGQGPVRLPNGMMVRQVNRHETIYLFDEIFQRQAYLQHGVTLRRGDAVVDVGGNIGLFALFVRAWIGDGRLLVVEPNPRVFEILRANLGTYAPQAAAVQVALSDCQGSARFTSYPGFSLFSGLAADPAAERAVVEAYERARGVMTGAISVGKEFDDLMEDRFRTETWEVRLETLSALLRNHGIETVDLLKINAEKSERRILQGINEGDWRRMRQVVLETDVEDDVEPVVELLQGQGFRVTVDQDPLLRDTSLRYVYAVRPEDPRESGDDGPGPDPSYWPSDAAPDGESLRAFLAARLPEAFVPACVTVVQRFPFGPNGKVDRQALLAASATSSAKKELDQPWASETEKRLAGIWSELLGRTLADRDSDFWDSGGHSLVAIQMAGRIRREFGVALQLREIFEHPVLAGLAQRIDQQRSAGVR